MRIIHTRTTGFSDAFVKGRPAQVGLDVRLEQHEVQVRAVDGTTIREVGSCLPE